MDLLPDDDLPTTVALIAFAAGGMVRGAVTLRANRIADLLESGRPLRVRYAAFQGHDRGPVDHLGYASIGQDRLMVVVATGPRGRQALAAETRTVMVRLEAGCYEVVGRLHVPVGARFHQVLERQRWVAVSDACVTSPVGATRRSTTHETVLVAVATIAAAEITDDPDAPEEEQGQGVGAVAEGKA